MKPPSPSVSASGRFVNNVKRNSTEHLHHYTENSSKSSNKLGVTMHGTEMTNALTPTSRFYRLYFHFQNEIDSKLPSRLEIAFSG